jgi:hypothetical protein
MAGLDPAIHALKADAAAARKGVDARNKSGHDDFFRAPDSGADWKMA